jgi:hypothetical protein
MKYKLLIDYLRMRRISKEGDCLSNATGVEMYIAERRALSSLKASQDSSVKKVITGWRTGVGVLVRVSLPVSDVGRSLQGNITKWVPGALSTGVKRPELEAEHSPPSSVEVKNTWN